MGMMVSDSATRDVIGKINERFEAGESIAEMAALQREFRIFSPEHGLHRSWQLLNIKASDPAERPRWQHWTDRYLRTLPSDLEGVNGHDRLVKAFQENLESANPLPMFYKHHLDKDDHRVLVTRGHAALHSTAEHIVISVPIIPVP